MDKQSNLKMIIAGSHDVTDIQLLYNALNKSGYKQSMIAEIVSGGALVGLL